MASSLNKVRSSKLVGNGSAKTIVLGYQPKMVKLINVTDRISYEKYAEMAAKKALKTVAAGTGTYVDAITINSDGFTIEAAEFVAAKEFHYIALESKSDY